MPETHDNNSTDKGRREFIAGGLAITAAAALGAPVIAALCANRREKPTAVADEWRLLEEAGESQSGKGADRDADGKPSAVRAVTFKVSKPDGWRLREEDVCVYVVRQADGAAPLVFSSVCPHAGCVVDFQPKEKHFFCPCHKGTFGIDGSVLDGPPPRKLDCLPTEKRTDGLYVKLVRYQQGIKEPKEIES